MKTNKPAVFTLVVPEKERRVYAAARTILVRKMKNQAPELGELILHELRLRRPGDIADEYLDFTGWLPCDRRTASYRSGEEKKLRLAA
ncbi:hypothetical protein [Geminisphaera colitermitum]|uniref:hypothetical protein n=1 Tax=Geminisphaera colitermitum TaxID=1148786 RepID=UPI000158D336|nr:hypothetical protein [Geminisphaera colitermitum]